MITPLDIQNKVFKKDFRGYNAGEVDEFLNLIIDGYEKLYRENIESRDKISSLKEALDRYKTLEETLKNTLVVAQSTGEKVQTTAREKAELIIAEAQDSARRLIGDAHDEVKKISFKYDEIKRSIDVYRARMTALLQSQLDLLENVSASDKTLVELIGVKEALEELELQASAAVDLSVAGDAPAPAAELDTLETAINHTDALLDALSGDAARDEAADAVPVEVAE